MNKSAGLVRIGLVCLAWSGLACKTPPGSNSAPPTTAEAVALMQPAAVEVLPFTKPKSFDEDRIPDGLEVTARVADMMGDPIKAWGTFRFELYRFRAASGDPHGDRLEEPWTVVIATIRDQTAFWDRVTQTYRFPLSWAGKPLEPGRKYVLDMQFEPPDGERIFAKPYVFEFSPNYDLIRVPVQNAQG